jgi:hypothetical protein
MTKLRFLSNPEMSNDKISKFKIENEESKLIKPNPFVYHITLAYTQNFFDILDFDIKLQHLNDISLPHRAHVSNLPFLNPTLAVVASVSRRKSSEFTTATPAL